METLTYYGLTVRGTRLASLRVEDCALPAWQAYRDGHAATASVQGFVLEAQIAPLARAIALSLWDKGPAARSEHASCYVRYDGKPWSEPDARAIAALIAGVTDPVERGRIFDLLAVAAEAILRYTEPAPTGPAIPLRSAVFHKDADGKTVAVDIWDRGQTRATDMDLWEKRPSSNGNGNHP